MGPGWWIVVICRRRRSDFSVAAYQDHEHRYRRAAALFGCCRASVSDARRFTETPYSFWRTRAVRCHSVRTFCDLVLARAPSCAEILSPSFLRRRRDSNRIFPVVLAHCTTDSGIQSDAGPLSNGAGRLFCPAVAGSKVFSSFSLVAGCQDCFHHRCRLWESPPVVSTSAGSGRRCIRRRRMWLCWIQNLFASGCNHIVNLTCSDVPDFCLRLCPTIL